MERIIKFRAWDIEENKYFKPEYEAYKGNLLDLSVSFSGSLMRRTLQFPSEHESCFKGRYILEQFTGLKDKNGVELYEGDCVIANGWKLVKTHDCSNARSYVSSTIRDTYDSIYGRYEFICYWNDCFSQFDFKEINKNEEIASDVSDRDYEIIGNIHTK